MIHIDGSNGEGGGQILRTALGLSLATGQPFRISQIRARRAKPGLLRQHLTAVRAAVEVSDAEAEGGQLGSRELVFRPRAVKPGNYHFTVGTAGSTTLVLQTVLPALMLAREPSVVVVEGGTHNMMAPPYDFIAKAYLPALEQIGPKVGTMLDRYGFYPAGGGRFTASVGPCTRLKRIDLLERGEVYARSAVALVANLPEQIAKREAGVLNDRLNWNRQEISYSSIKEPPGPGNVVLVEVKSGNVTEVFSSFGERGKTAETVAQEAADQALRYLASGACVGEYLADQLMLPMALAGGGSYTACGLSQHARTNIETIGAFLKTPVEARKLESGNWLIRVGEVVVPAGS